VGWCAVPARVEGQTHVRQYSKLSEPKNIGAFAVVYGLFLAFGEAGPGNCIGLLASKSSPTPFRGQYYVRPARPL
jgi:hypothetical protein